MIITWSRKFSSSMWSIRSRCEWNGLTTVNGTFNKYSTMKPSVTSSGNRILSPIATNFPLLASGIIFIASARLMQNPAPPVANQNFTFSFSRCLSSSLECFLFRSRLMTACKQTNDTKWQIALAAAHFRTRHWAVYGHGCDEKG